MSNPIAVYKIPAESSATMLTCSNCNNPGVQYVTPRYNETRKKWCSNCADEVLFHNQPVFVDHINDLEPCQESIDAVGIESTFGEDDLPEGVPTKQLPYCMMM